MSQQIEEEFTRYIMERVEIQSNGCWIWKLRKDALGYGHCKTKVFRINLAHRLSYTVFKGKIPDGLHVDHLCRNRGCVNPNHLEAVTPQVNSSRATRKRTDLPVWYGVVVKCPFGHEKTTVYNKHGQRFRVCLICKKANNHRLFKAEKLTNIRIIENMEKFQSDCAKIGEIKNQSFIDSCEKDFGKAVFLSAIKLTLFSQGVITYSPTVLQAFKYLHKALDQNKFTLPELAVAYGLTITKTKLKKKPAEVIGEKEKKWTT